MPAIAQKEVMAGSKRKKQKLTETFFNTALVISPPKSSSVSSPSSRTLSNTRFPHGSSTGNAMLSRARTARFSPTVSTASSVRTWSVSRRFARTGV